MILSTHAIVGGALASLFPSHPALVVAAGFPSHFAIDAIPHWDYKLRAISVAPGARNQPQPAGPLLYDLGLIGFDACAGLGLALLLFATRTTAIAIALGAIAAMLPDPLQFVHSLYPREPLKSLQSFHRWIHTQRQLSWPIGVSSQALFATLVATAAL